MKSRAARTTLSRTSTKKPTRAASKPTRAASKPSARDGAKPAARGGSSEAFVQDALAWLKQHASKATFDSMARYGIPSHNALGVTMANMKALGKRLGKNHALALALWKTGGYEARTVAAFVAEPALLTPAQMDSWCRDFDSWAICDTVCFHLFDRTPHAWPKVTAWAGRREEFIKRAAFALLWGLTVHDKRADDAPFVRGLVLIERAAEDERHLVKKAVNMALRATGKRSPALNAAAVKVAARLAASAQPAPRWVGKDALRELESPALAKRLAARPPR